MPAQTIKFRSAYLFIVPLIALCAIYSIAKIFEGTGSNGSTYFLIPLKSILSDGSIKLNQLDTPNVFDFDTATSTCNIPELPPEDDSIKAFVEHPRSVQCNNIQPELTYLDANGVLHLNVCAVYEYQVSKNESTPACYYSYFYRGKEDRDIVYEEPVSLDKPIALQKNFVMVKCHSALTKKQFYTNIHAHPVTSDFGNQSHISSAPDEDDLNVFIFGLESSSLGMVRRHLPKTYEYLTKIMNITVFRKTLKAGENTLPNMAAWLTGLRARHEQDNMPRELPWPRDGFYDDWPFVWKDYRLRGYESIFLEDCALLSTFHYGNKGFEKPTVDYFYFPFWEARRTLEAKMPVPSSQFCFGNRPVHEIYLDILLRHLRSGMGIKQILTSIFATLSHDYTSDLEKADDDMTKFFTNLHENSMLNRTLLIIAGDHGHRFSDLRPTVVGFVEERTPFLAMSFPDWFLVKHSRIARSFQINENRLVSPYDVHATLLDVLHKRYDGSNSIRQNRSSSNRGLSLLKIVPHNRTCFEADIPDRYCLCHGMNPLPVNHSFAQAASNRLLQVLNDQTVAHRDKCLPWQMKEVKYFIGNVWPEDFAGSTNNATKTYFMSFSVDPASAAFEGAVVRNMTDNTFTYVEGTLERISKYGLRVWCMPALWEFCACKGG